jgi:iron complex transport system permease protein
VSRLRLRPGSPRARLGRHAAVLLVAGLALLAVAVLSLGTGDFGLTPDRVLTALAGGGSRQENLIVGTVRLPRILAGLLVGAALALSGAIVQTLARNSLASPDLLGITAGASAGAVAVITLGGTGGVVAGTLREVGVPLAAAGGAAVAAVLVAVLLGRTGTRGLQPLLVGIGVSIFFGGLVSLMMTRADITDAARANVWLTGSLNGRSWPELWPVAAVLVVAAVVLVPIARHLGALALGVDVARALGVGIRPVVIAYLLVAVLLAAVATSAAGPIGFVALVAPHLARLATGATRAPLVASALLGALLIAVTDLVARTVIAPILLPVGAVVAVVGAPFLVWLLVSSRRKASS